MELLPVKSIVAIDGKIGCLFPFATWKISMNKLCIFVGLTVGSYLGWWLGMRLEGFTTALILSSVGSIAGVVLGWHVNRKYLS